MGDLDAGFRYTRGGAAPQPGDVGPVDKLLRYRILQDGIDACLRSLPRSDKGVARKLQEAWLLVDDTVRRLHAEKAPDWQLPLQE